jgi:DNA helicase-2/ATP-dependent DNA helicase PcrA
VIDRNRNRTPKQLFTERGRGELIILYEALDDHAEAAFVVETIGSQLRSGKARGGDFAVMYRTNAQSRLLEEAFMHAGLPYRLVGAQRFYGRREVKDVIAYLRLVYNPSDEVSLQRVINTPPRKIGSKTLASLASAAFRFETASGAIVLDMAVNGEESPFWDSFSSREAAALSEFGVMLRSWRTEAERLPLPDLMERILTDTDYQGYLVDGSQEGEDRWANIEELRRLAYEYQESDLGLVEFLENLALVSDQDTLPDKLDAPTLLTLHAAKGLEFDTVFIIGLDDGILPHSRSIDSGDPEEMAEERRLFYVGITRTRDRLYLLRAEQRNNYGSIQINVPSRFLDDIPDDLLLKQGVRLFSRGARWSDYSLPERWEPNPSNGRSASILEPEFKPNMRVRHPIYGEGVVLESRIEDGEETVDVHFESVGFKRLLASLAKLEIIP